MKIDGELCELAEEVSRQKERLAREIDLLVDRLVVREGIERRLADSLEVASRYGQERVRLEIQAPGLDHGTETLLFSQNFACAHCGVSYPEMTPRIFSFNSPYGACGVCGGLGTRTGSHGSSDGFDSLSAAAICSECQGTRLKKESLQVRIGGRTLRQ